MLIPNNAAVIGALSGGGGGGLQSVSHDNSLTGNGTAESQLGVKISEDADNQLALRDSGLFVPPPPESGLSFVSHDNSLTGLGTSSQPLTVKISNRVQNALSFVDNDSAEGGLFVDRFASGIQVISSSTRLDPGKPVVIVTALESFTQSLPAANLTSGEVWNVFAAESSRGTVTVTTTDGATAALTPGSDASFYSDGTRWILLAVHQKNAATSPAYALFNLSRAVMTNIAVGDHCPFDQAEQREDPNNLIALGTADYTTQPAVLCKGRVRLKGGYVYDLTGQIASVGETKYFGYSIWDVTDGSPVIVSSNGAGFATSQQDPNVCAATATGIVHPLRDMLIELRLTGGDIVCWYHGNSNLPECYLKIVCLGRAG